MRTGVSDIVNLFSHESVNNYVISSWNTVSFKITRWQIAWEEVASLFSFALTRNYKYFDSVYYAVIFSTKHIAAMYFASIRGLRSLITFSFVLAILKMQFQNILFLHFNWRDILFWRGAPTYPLKIRHWTVFPVLIFAFSLWGEYFSVSVQIRTKRRLQGVRGNKRATRLGLYQTDLFFTFILRCHEYQHWHCLRLNWYCL